MEASLADPVELIAVLHLDDVDLLLVADLDELHDGLLDEAVVDHLALAVLLYLDENSGPQSAQILMEYFVAVHGKGALGQRLVASALQVESFEVLHDLADGIGEDSEFPPLIHILDEERIGATSLRLESLLNHGYHLRDLLFVHLVQVLRHGLLVGEFLD